MAVYTTEEIVERILPVVQQYKVERVWLFGSYARGDATEKSDVDLIIKGEFVHGWDFFGLMEELKEVLQKEVDMLSENQFEHSKYAPLSKRFVEEVEMDRRLIFNGDAE